eukprot:scaffold113887_cov20-Tisochrysis_lutea.AAC.2
MHLAEVQQQLQQASNNRRRRRGSKGGEAVAVRGDMPSLGMTFLTGKEAVNSTWLLGMTGHDLHGVQRGREQVRRLHSSALALKGCEEVWCLRACAAQFTVLALDHLQRHLNMDACARSCKFKGPTHTDTDTHAKYPIPPCVIKLRCSMISLAANARAHGNSSLNSACNAALRALKQGPHSGVLLVSEEDEEEEEEQREGSPPPAPEPYVNR